MKPKYWQHSDIPGSEYYFSSSPPPVHANGNLQIKQYEDIGIIKRYEDIPEYQNNTPLPPLLLFMQMVIANYTLGARRVKATASHNMLPRCSMPTDDSFKVV